MNIVKASESDGIELLYRNRSIHNIPFSDVIQFNKFCDILEVEQLVSDIDYSKQFNIPQHYLELDVEQYILNLLLDNDSQKKQRVQLELELFRTRNLFSVFQLLIYIVDTMRKHNVVWGVGRGSSVASYCLVFVGRS